MLTGIDPILTGRLLMALDSMGHSDRIAIVDAHFPAARLGPRVVELAGVDVTRVVRAVCTVIPLDTGASVDLMANEDGAELDVYAEIAKAAGAEHDGVRRLSRVAFYQEAERAQVIVRTGEVRTYANAVLHKGIVIWAPASRIPPLRSRDKPARLRRES